MEMQDEEKVPGRTAFDVLFFTMNDHAPTECKESAFRLWISTAPEQEKNKILFPIKDTILLVN